MKIQEIPEIFKPKYKSDYPSYSNGKNIEELYYEKFINEKNNIKTDLIYLPIFWTSYYLLNNYAQNIDELYNFLDTLDKSKKYFTIVQYASGIFVKNFNLNIIVFTAGGGGLNIKDNNIIRIVRFSKLYRHIFYGNTGDYILPLLCLPLLKDIKIKRPIFCSFIGRLDTHKCRYDLYENLKENNKFIFLKSSNKDQYEKILNTSIFSLCPRGYGYTSFRLFEAICCGSIPIYVWEDKKVLPFEDILDWNKFSIIINSKEINLLPSLLEKINIEDMKIELDKVKTKFDFESSFKYLISKIKY